MDLSDLPEPAQHRIAAAEIEADSIAENARASASQIIEAYQFGVDPLGIDQLIYGDSLAVRAARSELANGRDWAAGHLFGATASEYLKAGKLDIERFNAKLNVIGDWITQKYGINRAVLDQMKQECRKAALRKRAAALEAGESKGTIIAKLPAEAIVRMVAKTAAFLADYLPKLEREANRSGPGHDAELLREKPKGLAPNAADSNGAASVQPVTVNGGNGKDPEPHFPKRASWLKDRLLERGWSNSDPSKYRGPDRKTIEKILRGEAVRNDVVEKLADALSSKPPKVSVLDIPQD